MITHQRSRNRFAATRLLLILNLCLACSSIGLWFIAWQQDLDWRGDFSAYYTGWTIIRAGAGEQLYNLETERRYQQQILGPNRSFSDGLLPFTNPPHAALPFVPLALLPRSAAFLLWTLAQLVLLICLLQLLVRLAHDWTPTEQRLMLVAVCAFPPLMRTMLVGTLSLLMLICLLQFYLALKRDGEAQAGIWLTFVSLKFQLALLPGVALLAGRRWRVLKRVVVFGGAWLLVTTFVLGWRIWPAYLSTLGAVSQHFGSYGTDPSIMYNLRGTLALVLGKQHLALINQFGTTLLVASALCVAWLWRGAWHADDPRFALRMAFTLLLSVLCNPHVNPHDGLVLVAPAVLFYDYLRYTDSPRRAFGAFALLCPLLFLMGDFVIGDRLGVRVPVVLMLCFAGWMAHTLHSTAQQPYPAPSA